MRTMFNVSNATSDESCITHHREDPAACMFAPIVFSHLSSRMFILEAAYDSWQVAHILGFPCATYFETLENCSAAQNASLETYGRAMKNSIQEALSSSTHHAETAGAFVSQCIIH